MPEQSYKFIQNKLCDYYPCHITSNPESFNCLFCYCPLYFLDECCGNYKLVKGVKDCSNCMIPHATNGYEHINNRIIEENNKRKLILESKTPKPNI